MTPQNSTDNKPCLQLQVAIDTLVNLDSSLRMPVENTALNFLQSQENINASPIRIISDFKGKYSDANKKGQVKVQYYEEVCSAPDYEDDVDRCADNTTSVTHTGKTTKEFYTDIYHRFEFKVNRDGQRDQCYDVEEVKRDLFGAHKRVQLRAINKKIFESMIAATGGYLNQSSPVTSLTNPETISILDAKGMFNPQAVSLMQNQFQKKDFVGDVAWFGDSNGYLNMAALNQKFATQNTYSGIDLTKAKVNFDAVYGFNSFSGFSAGSDHILGVPYGSMQLIQWWANKGDYDEGARGFLPGTNAYKTTMELWGYEWDVKVERQGCYDLFFMELRLGVAVLPAGTCKDRLPLHFVGGCGDIDCSAIGNNMGL